MPHEDDAGFGAGFVISHEGSLCARRSAGAAVRADFRRGASRLLLLKDDNAAPYAKRLVWNPRCVQAL